MIDPAYLRAASTPEGLANMLANSQMAVTQAMSAAAAMQLQPPTPQPVGDESSDQKRTRSSSLATGMIAPDGKAQRTRSGKQAWTTAGALAARSALPPPAEPTKEVKSHTARSLIRMLRAGTGVKTPNNIPIVEAEEVIKKLAGEFAPVEILKTKKRNAGREALSVLLTMYLQKPISMADAAQCFHNPTNRGLEPTTRLWELLGETRTWPPYPETRPAKPPPNMMRPAAVQQFKQPQPRLHPGSVHRQPPIELTTPGFQMNPGTMHGNSLFGMPGSNQPTMTSPFSQGQMPSPYNINQPSSMPMSMPAGGAGASMMPTPMPTPAGSIPSFMQNQHMPQFTAGMHLANNFQLQQMPMSTNAMSNFPRSPMNSQPMPSMPQQSQSDNSSWDASPFGGAGMQQQHLQQPQQQSISPAPPQASLMPPPAKRQPFGSSAPSPGQPRISPTEIASPFSSSEPEGTQETKTSPTSKRRDESLSGLLNSHLTLQQMAALTNGQDSGPVKNSSQDLMRVPPLGGPLGEVLPRDTSLSGLLAPVEDQDKQENTQDSSCSQSDRYMTLSGILQSDGGREATLSGMFGSSQPAREATLSGLLGSGQKRDTTLSGVLMGRDSTLSGLLGAAESTTSWQELAAAANRAGVGSHPQGQADNKDSHHRVGTLDDADDLWNGN
eukprot:scaffold203770_cov46-Prasinocladus_malaysianus.AAC.1